MQFSTLVKLTWLSQKKELNLVLSEVFVIEGNHHLHKFLKSNVC